MRNFSSSVSDPLALGTHSRGLQGPAALAAGFTLLEMVLVLVIMAVLLGGVMSQMGRFGEGAKIQRVETDFQALSSALLQYKNLAGRFPTTQQGLEALVSHPKIPPKPRRYPSQGYLKALPRDPWDSPYQYRNPGKIDPTTFEIFSYGPDQKEGGGDDLSSQDPLEAE